MTTVLILGGGITGLTTAYELQKQLKMERSDIQLILAEANDQLGGKIRTAKKSGFIMETGADSIVARKLDKEFLSELQLENEIVHNSSGTSYLYTDGTLKQIPLDTVFGIPASIESLAKTPLISAEGKVEALRDLYVPNHTFTNEDSVGEFLEYFFGKELTEKQIAPVLSGVYSGKLTDLTLKSTLPQILEYKNTYGSIIKGFEANREKYLASDKKFLSFKGGLQTVIEQMAAKMENVKLLFNFKAETIEKSENGYEVSFANGEIIEADYIVLSIPHHEADKLLYNEELHKYFREMKTGTLYSVYLGFNVPDEILPADGTGFITTEDYDLSCNACTWTSRKWRHTSGNGNLLVRLFYKNSHPDFASIKDLSEAELVKTALSDVKKSLKLEAMPIVHEVTKWENQMPAYQINHPKIIEALENTLADQYEGIILAGSSYYGVGIPDCIENGRNTAKRILNKLTV